MTASRSGIPGCGGGWRTVRGEPREGAPLILPAHGAGTGGAGPRGRDGGCGPHFSFVLPKEKSPPRRWKRKALWCPNPALWAGLDKDGGRARRCPRKLRVSYRVRLGLGEQRGCFPAFGSTEGLSGWLTDLTSYSFRAFRFATRYRVVGGAAAAGRKSNRFCSTTHESSASRAARLQVLAKLCPRPALNLTSTAQCLLLGPRVLSK